MAEIRQSRQDSCLGFQVKVLHIFKLPPFRSEAAGGVSLEDESRSAREIYFFVEQQTNFRNSRQITFLSDTDSTQILQLPSTEPAWFSQL